MIFSIAMTLVLYPALKYQVFFFTWKSQYFTDIYINHVYSQPSKYLLFYSWFVGPAITLQDCLAAFFSADELKGDNMYSCEKCKK